MYDTLCHMEISNETRNVILYYSCLPLYYTHAESTSTCNNQLHIHRYMHAHYGKQQLYTN